MRTATGSLSTSSQQHASGSLTTAQHHLQLTLTLLVVQQAQGVVPRQEVVQRATRVTRPLLLLPARRQQLAAARRAVQRVVVQVVVRSPRVLRWLAV